MAKSSDVLCSGIIVADHVCTPIDYLPKEGESVLTDDVLLSIGGCAADVATGLVRMGVPAAVVGRVGKDAFGRVVLGMLRAEGVNVSAVKVTPNARTSQTMIVNVAGQDRRFIHCVGAN